MGIKQHLSESYWAKKKKIANICRVPVPRKYLINVKLLSFFPEGIIDQHLIIEFKAPDVLPGHGGHVRKIRL